MPAILTLDYEYKQTNKQWFTKAFSSFPDLFKWIRDDSIIILPEAMLNDETHKRKLILTKLALPKVSIIVLSKVQNNQYKNFFNYIEENKLEELIRQKMINQHNVIDNRKNLAEIINLFS